MFVAPILGSLLLAVNPATPVPSGTLLAENCELGEVVPFSRAKCNAALSSISDHPINVIGVRALKEGFSATANGIMVPPHGKAYLSVDVNVGNAAGAFGYPLHIETDEAGKLGHGLRVYGFALTDIDQLRPELDLGVVNLDKTMPKQSVTLTSNAAADFKILKIIDKPNWVDTAIMKGTTLEVSARKNAPLGLNDGYVKLAIQALRQKEAWVHVKADVHGDVVPSANPLDMGLMRFGNENKFLIRLTSRAGKDFRVGKVELQDIAGATRIYPCIPAEKACQTISLTVSDDQPSGTIKGRLWVDLPDEKQRLPINLWGLIVAKDFKIGTIDDSAHSDGTSSPVEGQEKPLDVMSTLKSNAASTASAELPPPPGNGPLLKWVISNGASIYGFQIFRSSFENGPFTLLTPDPIRATKANDALTYQWRDSAAVSGRSYWYYIGIVNMDGSKASLSKPKEIVAK